MMSSEHRKNDRTFPACVTNLHDLTQDRPDTTTAEGITMIVQFDEVSATWRVVADDGAIIMDGFATDAAAWRWADQHDTGRRRRG